MTFTPGSDEGRTDTYDAQKKLQEDDQTAEEQFDEAQGLLKKTGEALYGLGLLGVGLVTRSPQAVQGVHALRSKLEGKPFVPPSPNSNAPGLVNLEPITTEEAFTRPDMGGTGKQPEIEDVPMYPTVIQRILKVKRDNPEVFSGILGQLNPNSKKQEDKRQAGLGEPRRFKFTKTYRDEKYTNKLYNELINVWGMKDGTLDFDRYLAVRPTLPNSKRRILGGLFATPTGSKVSFSDAQDALIKSERGLKSKYKNLIKSLGFPERQFQLHHVVPVLASLPGYHGLRFASPEWWEVTEILFNNMMRAGDDQFNFVELVGGNKLTKLKRDGKKDRIFPTPHSVTHKFLDHYIGDDGQLFWTKDVRDKMAGTGAYSEVGPDMEFRRDKWQEYAELVQKSEDITNQAEEVFRDLYEDIPEEQLEDELDVLIERLARLDSDGSLNLYRTGSGRYEVTQMKELVMEIRNQMQESEAQMVLDSLTGREERQREFVRKRVLAEIENRALDNMSVSDQMKEIQRLTGMTIEDIQTKIQTENFDIKKFIRENQ